MKSLLRPAMRAIVFAVMITITFALHAQSTTGTIFGTVTDATGAAIPGATITLTETRTNVAQNSVADARGEFTYAIVNPGEYKVSASSPGFKTTTQTGIALAANQNIRVPFALVTGAVTESVSVEAGVTLVDTREAQLAETIDQNKLENLPTLNRDAYSLMTTTPGVNNYSADSVIGSRAGVSVSVNGLPTGMESYYLDGSYDDAINVNGGNKIPNPDALSEFRIITSNFDAEFGRSPSGVVNAITRSGTDHFHGSAYDYLRNNILNARNYFVQPTSPTNPAVQLQQNQFGARIGGPVKLLKQTFFFLDYQGTILRQQAVVNAGVVQAPTAAERAGDFSQDAAAGAPGSANSVFGTSGTFQVPKLPAGANCGTTTAPVVCNGTNYNPAVSGKNGSAVNFIDPVAQAVLKFVPVGAPVGSAQVGGVHSIPQQTAPANSLSNEGVARFDFNGIRNHAIEAMLYYTRGNDTNPTAGGNQILDYGGSQDVEQQFNIVAADIWTLSDRTVNSFRAFESRNHYTISNLFDTTVQQLGSLIQPAGNIFSPSLFNLTNYVNIGGTAHGPANVNQVQYGGIDTIELTRGRHSIKLGGSYIYGRNFNNAAISAGSNFGFTGSLTKNTFADFLIGSANSLTQQNVVEHHVYSYDPALYAQDDWQITRRLNLNLGVRWEVFAPFLGDNTFGTFSPNVQSKVIPNAPIGLLYQGDPGIPPSTFNISYLDFSPRVGFAYDVFGDGKTSLRGGFGIFYFDQDATNYDGQTQTPYGLSVVTNQTPNLVCPYGVIASAVASCPANTTVVPPNVSTGTADPFPYNPAKPNFASPQAGSTIFAVPPGGGTTPYVYEYNLTAEQQLSPTFALHVAYVGNELRHNYITIDENAPVYSPTGAISTAGLLMRRPYEPYTRSTTDSNFRFGAIMLDEPSWNGRYNSLQTTLRGRFGPKFSMFASYVWSKSLDFNGPTVDNYDIGMNFGPSNNDLRHRFVVSYLYELPTTRRFGLFGREVLDGWHVNGITAFNSGSNFVVTSGVDTNLDGTTNDRVDVLGNPNLGHLSRAQKIHQGTLNPADLSQPTGPYGDEQRNQFTGPANINTDLSLFKQFALVDHTSFQFRAEAFNAFGNVNLNNPRTALSNIQNTAPTYNQITGSGPARRIQFSARILF